MRLVLRGHVLVDADAEPAGKSTEKSTEFFKRPNPLKVAEPEKRCGRTIEAIEPATFKTIIVQCIKEKHPTQLSCVFQVKGPKPEKPGKQLGLKGV